VIEVLEKSLHFYFLVKFHQWETMLVVGGCELGVTNGHYHTWLCGEILQFYLIIRNVVKYFISSQGVI
jgi:hypothetical protein